MKTNLFQTRNSLPPKIRRAMVELLNQALADALDLILQAKQAHWNVKGPHFIVLHELFDKVAEEMEESADGIAERAVELGGVALGTTQVIAKKSRLSAYPLDASSGREHVAALSSALAEFGTTTRTTIDTAIQRRKRVTRTRPTCSRKCRAVWTNYCGWSRPKRNRRNRVLPFYGDTGGHQPHVNKRQNRTIHAHKVGSVISQCVAATRQKNKP
jgi:starvation-inducible DNA-binding protein